MFFCHLPPYLLKGIQVKDSKTYFWLTNFSLILAAANSNQKLCNTATWTPFKQSFSLFDRSLLLFAKGKPLGKKGFEWLKTHCINLTELKKKSPVAERLAYADEVMEDILGRVFFYEFD